MNNKLTKAGMEAAISNVDAETFRVTHKLNLLVDEGAYMLIVDSQKPIQSIVL